MRLATCLAVLLAVAPAAAAQDSDGDGVPNGLEQNGFRFDVTSGEAVACNPATDDPCYVTDPLAWSSDGDPYSDFQEASGVNMDATIDAPYNDPLVAAYPVIEVKLASYVFTPRATISDSRGNSIASGSESTFSVEATASVSTTVGVSSNPLEGFGVSAEVTASLSTTVGYSRTTSSSQEFSWESARTTEVDNAATLALAVYARNAGGATALNVRPTFNVLIGDELIATILPDAPMAASLAPGDSTAALVPNVNGVPIAIQLSLRRLVALQRGAPVTIQVVDMLADIQRWDPSTSNWTCGTGDTCSWETFQNQIDARTLRLIVDFGYSGDTVGIPAAYRDAPFDYRVFTGSPSTSPDLTLAEVLRIAGFDVAGAGAPLAIEGRPYPSGWILIEQPGGGDRPIQDAWVAAGQPQNLLEVVMPPEATLSLLSPDPVDPGAALRLATASADLLNVFAVAAPRGGVPIVEARAVVLQRGQFVTVPLLPVFGTSTWMADATDLGDPIGVASSYVEFVDLAGGVRRSEGLALPVAQAATCASVPPGDLLDPAGNGGRATLFPTDDLDKPVEAYCERTTAIDRFWVPQPGVLGTSMYAATVLEDGSTVAVGTSFQRSFDRGRTWLPIAQDIAGQFLTDIDDRSDTGTVVAVGTTNPAGSDIVQDDTGFFRSADGGESWTWQDTVYPLGAVTHADGDVWFAVSEGSFVRVFKSVDDGRVFGLVTLPETPRNLVDVAFRDANTGIVLDRGDGSGGSGRIWRTEDGGATWTKGNYTDVRSVAYAGDGTWYVVQRRNPSLPAGPGNLLRSRDDGRTWEPISLGVGRQPFRVAFASPDVGFIVDSDGILRTEDGGDTWTLEPEIPDVGMWTPVVYDENRALIVGFDNRYDSVRGLSLLTTSGGSGIPDFSVGTDPAGPVEAVVALDPAAPNPFRDRTTLTYRLDAPGSVELVVFDLLGREVARLVDGPQRAGEHTTTWAPLGLASGVYVARLRVGDAVTSRTVTVVR